MSTNDFVERVQSIHMDEMSFMARIDAKHFYMSGTIHQLIESSVQVIPDPKTREFAIRVAFFCCTINLSRVLTVQIEFGE